MSGGRKIGAPWGQSRTLQSFLLAVVAVLLLAAPVYAADAPLTPEGEPICVTCHASVSLDVVRTWRSQQHGQAGVGCDRCHNTHEEEFRPSPTVAVCQECHDVEAIHGQFDPSSSAERCMACHTANVHLLAGPESWFQGGLPREDLAGETDSEGISARAAGGIALVAVVAAVLFGLGAGWLLNRFVRDL